ncbi:MAG: PhoU domain-containing protein [Sulfolobales archaeon]
MSTSLQEERRIQEVRGSYILYLPKEWCRDLNLGKGSRVLIKRVGSKLVIEPSEAPRIRLYSDVDLDEIGEGSLYHMLISLYISGAEQIKVVSKKPLSSEVKKMISIYVKHMPGFSLFDEARNFLVLREVRRGSELNTVVRRIILNARSLFEYVIKTYGGDRAEEDLEELDSEIDAIRREAERIFNIMLTSPGLDGDSKLLQKSYIMVQIARVIERISDHLVAIAQYTESSEEDRAKIHSMLSNIYSYYTMIEELIKQNLQDEEMGRRGREPLKRVISRLVDLIESKKKIHSMVAEAGLEKDITAYHIMRIYDYITDIAEYVLDMIAISSLINRSS